MLGPFCNQTVNLKTDYKNLYYSKLKLHQRAKKVACDNPGLVDFAIGLVNSVLNLPNGQVKFFVKFQKKKKNCEINSAHQNIFGAP